MIESGRWKVENDLFIFWFYNDYISLSTLHMWVK